MIWRTRSLKDLERAHNFLAEHSVQAANQMIETILERVTQLERLPESGAVEPGLVHRNKEHRYLVSGHHKVVYRVDKQKVYIIRVFDTRQHPKKMR